MGRFRSLPVCVAVNVHAAATQGAAPPANTVSPYSPWESGVRTCWACLAVIRRMLCAFGRWKGREGEDRPVAAAAASVRGLRVRALGENQPRFP